MDAEYLMDLAGGDKALVREILHDFLASDANDRRNLSTAMAARDARAIEMHAHRIKGAARAIGATDYAEAAAAVEHAASTSAEIAPLVGAVEQASAALAQWAEAFE